MDTWFYTVSRVKHLFSNYFIRSFLSMGIVGVKSTAGREVKFIDPSKTTKSESTWLGYPLCDWYITVYYIFIFKLSLYNEERRLGVQRGSDTLVVPLITSNDGLSIAFLNIVIYALNLQILGLKQSWIYF